MVGTSNKNTGKLLDISCPANLGINILYNDEIVYKIFQPGVTIRLVHFFACFGAVSSGVLLIIARIKDY